MEIKKFWFLFLVLIIEGSSLMTVELLGAKLLTPFFGSSLYVWTAVLSITVPSLTLGYYSGGATPGSACHSKTIDPDFKHSGPACFCITSKASLLISITSGMGLISGICIASFFLLAPPMFCFGMIGPWWSGCLAKSI